MIIEVSTRLIDLLHLVHLPQ